MKTSQTFTLEQVRQKLSTDQNWLERAIVKLFERQTADEQRAEMTKHHNKVGFNGVDGKRLSYYAKWLNSGKRLSGYHLKKAFAIVPKYAKQVLSMIEANNQDNKVEEPVPPKQPKYLNGHSKQSEAFEDEQFRFEQQMQEIHDPSDRYGHYSHMN